MAPKKVSAVARVVDAAVATATTVASPNQKDGGVATSGGPVVAPTAGSSDIGVPVTKVEQTTGGTETVGSGLPDVDAAGSMAAPPARRRRSRGSDTTDHSESKRNKKEEK
jgi:hypothetical protein